MRVVEDGSRFDAQTQGLQSTQPSKSDGLYGKSIGGVGEKPKELATEVRITPSASMKDPSMLSMAPLNIVVT